MNLAEWQVWGQAAVAATFTFVATRERRLFQACGFTLVATAAGVMVVRRITARLETIDVLNLDRLILPGIITVLLLAGAVMFLCDTLTRGRYAKQRAQ